MGDHGTRRGLFIIQVTVNGSKEVEAIWDPGADHTIVNPSKIPGYIGAELRKYSGSLAYADGRKLQVDGITNAAIKVRNGKDTLMTPSIVAHDVDEPVILGNHWYDVFVEENIKSKDVLILKGSKDVVQMLRSNEDRCCGIKIFKKCVWTLEKDVMVSLDSVTRAVVVPSIDDYGTKLRADMPKSYRKQVEWMGSEVDENGVVVVLLKAKIWNKLVLDEGMHVATSIKEGSMGANDSEGKHAVENAAEKRVVFGKGDHHSAQPE